ncbi:hypothetical protein N9E82_00355 [bacterium]|nr:hypothetical protein [bacterium]
MNKNVTIQQLDPNTFEYQNYSNSDSQLIVQSQLDTIFSEDTDYIEYYAYDQNQNLIYPGSTIPLLDYDIRDGDVLLNPQKDLENTGFDIGAYNILYTFYRKRLSSNISEKYFIANISSDRTEIRLDSNIISNELVISSSNEFIQYREAAEYFVDFYLNFGNNQTVIANNIKLETEEGIDPTVLIKLYEPLPSNFNVKDELWVVEELSDPQAYELDFPFEPIIEDDFTYIAGPNYNLNVIQETSTGGEAFSFNTLLQSDVTSSINQIQNLLNQKEIDININYENYANFVHFSSAKIRLENFYYKVGLIESASNQLVDNNITTPTSQTFAYSSSKALLTDQIDTIIKNFDGYESFLYFNSGSQYSYPKLTAAPPYKLASTGSTEVLTWIGSATVGTTYYGGQALSASNYDQDNRNWLYWSIPEYLRDDPANEGYELFVDMVAQYYDNVWVYTKDVSNKFDADNRLGYGIAKDLVADAIKDFGVKLYASNFNTNDLFTAFLGITPSGSAFPFPNITGSLPVESGFEYVDTQISASNDIVPLNNVQKQVYKRIYHNIPYLLKTKGTIAGIRALITSYGIPDTILRISEFGGKDRNESQDYDLKQNVFNYEFNTGAKSTNFVSSSMKPNTLFPSSNSLGSIAGTVQFRFKSSGIPTASNNIASSNIRYSQSLWLTDINSGPPTWLDTDLGAAVVLEYTGSGFVSGSYSGSVASPYDNYGTLKFYPDINQNPNISCSIYAPFFNEDWWSVQLTYTGSSLATTTASLFTANEINGKIGFSGSDEKTNLDPISWDRSKQFKINDSINHVINNTTHTPFSGSFQEYRMYAPVISESKFFDYTVNPYSNEGNNTNSTPDEQFFRASLGTQLNTGSRTSIHPRVTGSTVQITSSFDGGDSSFILNGEKWITNVENIFQDQVPAGIKNRITDKIHKENLILAEAPYGFQTPTSSTATISSTTSSVLSPMESIQQQSFVSQSYTPNVNYLEVAFSPSNQINDDINAQLGYFNLGEYIGDPRFVSSPLDSYPDLDRLRDAYFEKYIKGYDVVDFIRLIKFFDNSLFKMIKDFTPARTSLASGVVVKQHLLERNRLRPAQVTSSQHFYEGLVVNLPKDYSSGSSDFPQYSTEGSALYKFSGGPGGSFNRYNGLQTSPSGSNGLGPDNRFNLTQSWTESFDYGSIDRSIINSTFFNQSSSQYISASYKGIREGVIHSDQSEFYNGVFSGSFIEVTNGDLNPGCEPYLNVADTPFVYQPIFFSTTNAGTVVKDEFLNQGNVPRAGEAWIASEQIALGGTARGSNQQVFAIKLNALDVNGVYALEYLVDLEDLRFIFPDANIPYNAVATKYIITGRTTYADHVLFVISQASGVGGNNYKQTVDSTVYYPITSSTLGGSSNWSLEAKTSFSTEGSINSGSSDNFQQNTLANVNSGDQSQNVFFWDGEVRDALGFFNTGSLTINTNAILGEGTVIGPIPQSNYFLNAAYTTPYTSNIPWSITASIVYSSSLAAVGGYSTDTGIYHSGSFYQGAGLTDQSFTLGTGFASSDTTLYRPAPIATEDLGNLAFNLDSNGASFNNLLPGNSGSGLPINDFGGHTKIKVAGTASLDFYFPSLTLAGTTQYPTLPPLNTGPGIQQYLSGSDFSSNPDFAAVFTTYFGVSDTFDFTGNLIGDLFSQSDGGTGAIKINFYDIAEYITSGPGEAEGQTTVVDMKFNFEKLIIDGGSSADFIVRAYFSIFNDGSGNVDEYDPEGFNTAIPIEFDIPGQNKTDLFSSGGKVDLSNVETEYVDWDEALPYDVALIGYFGLLYFTIENKSNDDLTYTFKLNLGTNILCNNTNEDYVDIPSNDGFISATVLGDGADDLFQDTSTIVATNDYYPQAVVDVFLKRTGSQGDNIITSSLFSEGGGYSGSYIPGLPMVFPDPSILGIYNNVLSGFDTSSTQNQIGDMYYVEYSMSEFKPGVISGLPVNSVVSNFETENGTDLTKIFIEQTYAGGDPNFNATGSLRLTQGNTSDTSTLGTFPSSLSWNLDENADGTTRVELKGEFTGDFFHNDRFGFSIRNRKVGAGSQLFINEITASIVPGQSIWSPIPPPLGYDNYRQSQNTNLIVSSYYPGSLPFDLALDCQPLLNNYNLQRQNPFIMDVDYTNISGPIIPINQNQILANTARRASTPDSNYTSLRSINPRYNGSKSTSQQLNVWNIGDTGTFGQNPTIELRDAYFGYFNDLDDPYPNINGLTRVNLSYLVDEQGNALPPSIEPITIDTFNAVFPNTTLGKIAVRDINSKYQDLGSPTPISRTMEYVTPICYSQNSGNNYSNIIPLSGSGNISRYDNGDADSVTFAQFSAAGTSSVETSEVRTQVSYFLDPSEDISQPLNVDELPYNIIFEQGVYKGATSYPVSGNAPTFDPPWFSGPGADLNNQQLISLQTSLVTSFVSNSYNTDKELQIHLQMFYGNIGNNGTRVPYNLEYINCKVYTETGQVYLITNVDQYGWFTYINPLGGDDTLGPAYKPNQNRFTTSRIAVPPNGIKFAADYAMYETLWNLGLTRERAPKDGGGILALEWIISANSGPQSITGGNEIKWKINGEIKYRAGGYQQGYFFPLGYGGAYTPTKIQGAGVQDHLLAEANKANAPFWVFSGSSGIDYSFIEMESPNFNEAYGTGFIQGDLPYEPGPSQYFPDNIEPKTTSFDPIVDALEFQEGDEIRFGNNENFTYRILEVFTPGENNGKVKLRLNKLVDTSINKDFFLVRRRIVNPNSLYLDTPFPYGTLSSGSISQTILSTGSQALSGSFTGTVDENGLYTGSVSDLELATTPGILFPDFPTEYLIQSASSIVNDLISKGIIDS